MKKITSFGLLALVASMMLGGINSAEAQIDPKILLDIALQAQKQTEIQLSELDDVPEEANKLFDEAKSEVNSLENAIYSDDITSVRQHFLTAMNTFKKITKMVSEPQMARAELASFVPQRNIAGDLNRMQKYIQNLKNIVQRQNADVDFSEVNKLFDTAKDQISENNFDEAKNTINQLKQLLSQISKTLEKHTKQRISSHAKDFIQKFIDRIDTLINKAKDSGYSQEIINKLEEIKENLSSATSRSDVEKEIQKLKLIKAEFKAAKERTSDNETDVTYEEVKKKERETMKEERKKQHDEMKEERKDNSTQ